MAKKIFPGRETMEIVSMINYSLPGTIVGIAYLIAFNDPPLVLTGTALIIVACYVFRYSPTGIRATVALLQQIDPSIEKASESLGASSRATFRRITIPLILPAFFAGLGVVFIRSMTAISATIFLVSINWTLITVRILENMTELSLGPAGVDLEVAGQHIRVSEEAARITAGQTIRLVVRPEVIELRPADSDAGIPGTIVSRTFLGEKAEYQVRVGGDLLQVTSYNPVQRGVFLPGQRVMLHFPTEGIQYLPEGSP